MLACVADNEEEDACMCCLHVLQTMRRRMLACVADNEEEDACMCCRQ